MKLSGALLLMAGALVLSSPFTAAAEAWSVGAGQGNGGHRPGYGQGHNGNGNGSNADVVVDMPPEVWTQGQSNQTPCPRCCTYENQRYSEGSVVKMEGVLLQCARDEKSWGTNNLTWQTLK